MLFFAFISVSSSFLFLQKLLVTRNCPHLSLSRTKLPHGTEGRRTASLLASESSGSVNQVIPKLPAILYSVALFILGGEESGGEKVT
jgi:hypothetical protein